MTELLLRGIRTNRAKVVVIDITGVAAMDATVANHLVQTVEASRLLGATVIETGLSPEIAQTIVNIGVDLGKMTTVGDLREASSKPSACWDTKSRISLKPSKSRDGLQSWMSRFSSREIV